MYQKLITLYHILLKKYSYFQKKIRTTAIFEQSPDFSLFTVNLRYIYNCCGTEFLYFPFSSGYFGNTFRRNDIYITGIK